ncbi:hypothetical protein [Bradyrhizobium sp.]
MVWPVLNGDQNTALKELIDQQQSDRIVAIVGASMLDDSLRQALEWRLRKSSAASLLFSPQRALGNTGPKIELAYLLNMFEKPTFLAMQGLADIRNLFAHRLSMTFADQDQKFKDALAKLTLHKGRTKYPNPFTERDSEYDLEPTDTVKGIFIVNLKLALTELMADMHKHLPHSNVSVPISSTMPNKAEPSPDPPRS